MSEPMTIEEMKKIVDRDQRGICDEYGGEECKNNICIHSKETRQICTALDELEKLRRFKIAVDELPKVITGEISEKEYRRKHIR